MKQMTFNTDIEKTEAEIKVLQKKLALLEEMEKYNEGSAREAFKETYGIYPTFPIDVRFGYFKAGYEAAQLKDVGIPECPDEPYRNVKAYWDEKDDPNLQKIIDKMVEERKSQKLRNMLKVQLDYDGMVCDDIVDIVEDWLPKEQSASGSQNTFVESNVEGYNDCLRQMKEMLR